MNAVTVDTYREMLALLNRLDEVKLHYTMRHSRPEAIMIEVFVPGERWEIEFVDYEDEVQVEVEVFRSNGEIDDETAIEKLFAKHSD